MQKWAFSLCAPLGLRSTVVYDLAFTVQPRSHAGMGQMFTFAHVGLMEYHGTKNVTLGLSRKIRQSPLFDYLEMILYMVNVSIRRVISMSLRQR